MAVGGRPDMEMVVWAVAIAGKEMAPFPCLVRGVSFSVQNGFGR